MTKFYFLEIRTSDNGVHSQRACNWEGEGPPNVPTPMDGHYIVALSQPVLFAEPSPTSHPFWLEGAFTWVEMASLEELRTAKNAQINAAWIAADSSAFSYAGETFRAEPDDVLRLNSINGYISLKREMPPDWIGVWKTMDDTFIALPDVASWEPFYTAFVMKGVTNYLAAQGLKAQLAAATTAAEIAAITWPA